jgi:4-amino-4-deoxy-L-arabinose transferase-like glycosyltransferase
VDSYFSGSILLISIVLLSILAWKTVRSGQHTVALVFMLLIALIIRAFVSSDCRFHDWDEQYHALVAKNLSQHPLKPTLYDKPVLDYDPKNWVGNHIWLEKPPVALWSMAASISIFGTNVWAVRLPSLLFGLGSVFLTFRLGSLLFDRRIGLFAAYLHAINGVIIELGGGRLSSDHVETAFIFFVELAVFFCVYFAKKNQNYWVTILIGVCTGVAFLTKWYPAGIVLPIWLICFVFISKGSLSDLFKHGILLLVSIGIIAVPWIWFICTNYPVESEIALSKFLGAYSVAVEDHDAPWYYYLHKIMVLFSELIYVVIGFSIYSLFKQKTNHSLLLLLVWITIPLVVFSLGETKRFTYLLIAAPAMFMLTGYLWFHIYDRLYNQRPRAFSYLFLAALVLLPLRLTLERTKLFNTLPEEKFYHVVDDYSKQLDSNDIVFGTDQNIKLMFYTDVCAAYPKIPSSEKLNDLKARGHDLFRIENQKLIKL